MKKIIYLILSICILSQPVFSAEEEKPAPKNYELKGIIGGSYNQTNVSDNWSKGEVDSRTWQINLDGSLENDFDNLNWKNSLKANFGKAKLDEAIEQTNVDLFYLESLLKWNIIGRVSPYPYASFTMDTQHTDFMDPGTLTEAVGVGFLIIKQEKQNLKTRTGVAFRQKFDRVDANNQSSVDDPTTLLRIEEEFNETGAEWITNYDYLFSPNTKFISEANAFTAFNGGASLRWDNSLFVKLGEYLTVQSGYLLIFDYNDFTKHNWPQDIETRLTLNIGVSYNLF